ncbi:tripartite motif-containing protein 2 isoform X2 [Parasteatoda tepidariorum]|uniref:tripartite motif-containing protein 2 isoform X2 n=1 Tax=Parasteatoda tepidariorum TaxID=114398 RepID=UPI001C72689E|nr:tripartite motif-containing protein 2 isoform X2 [Parasteatoda tepidariorum]
MLASGTDTDEDFAPSIPDSVPDVTSPVIRQITSQFLKCGICLDRYENPKVLPCLHTFCERCLVRYMPPESLTLSCPVCRQQSIVPRAGVPALQTNFIISNLMETLDHPSKCHRCAMQPSASKCAECEGFLCEDCSRCHQIEDATRNHKLLSLSEIALQEKQGSLMCPKHDSQTLRFYCRECETAICVTCTDIEHKGHLTIRLREAVNDQKEMLSNLLDNVEEKIPVVEKAIDLVTSIITSLDDAHQSAANEIDMCFNLLLESVHMRRSEMLGQLEDTYNAKRLVLDNQKSLLQYCLETLSSSCEFTKKALEHENDAEFLLVNKQVSDRLREYSVMQVKSMPEENDYLDFEDNTSSMARESIQMCGAIRTSHAVALETTATGEGLKQSTVGKPTLVNLITKDLKGEIVASDAVDFKVEITSSNYIAPWTIKPEMSDQKNGSYDLLYTVPKEGLYTLSIKLFGFPIKGSPFTVKAFPEEESSSSDRPANSKIPRTTGVRQRGNRRPSSYRSSSSNRWSIPIEDEFDLVLRVGKKGKNKGEFANPQGVCCTHEGKIVVADSNNQVVQVFSTLGEFKMKFGVRGRGPGQLQRPTGVAVSTTGNYVVADYENKAIFIYDCKGKFLNRIGYGKMLGPKGVVVDRNGHIIVADNKGNCVLIFQENGKLLHRFGARGSNNSKFAGPHYVAINSKNHLVVSDFHNHSIKVFDEEGNFLYSFGSNGEGIGQFNAPTGVAVDGQDNIIVADWGNSRIQVFDCNGSFLSFVNTNGEPLYGPQGLALFAEGYVVVADSGNHCLKVYKYLQ